MTTQTHTFYLQISDASHIIVTEESHLPEPRKGSRWERYKLTLTDGILMKLERTDSLVTAKRTNVWQHGQTGELVSINNGYIRMGKYWQGTSTTNKAVKALLEKMKETLNS